MRGLSGDPADAYVFRKPSGGHWVETDWRNYRSRHSPGGGRLSAFPRDLRRPPFEEARRIAAEGNSVE